MHEFKFRRSAPLCLEALEDRSLPSATPLSCLAYPPEGQGEYAFVDGGSSSEAEVQILGDEIPNDSEATLGLVCELSLLDDGAVSEVVTEPEPELIVCDFGIEDSENLGFCGTLPPELEDWCGTTTTDAVGEPPSLDGVVTVIHTDEPPYECQMIGLPDGPTEVAICGPIEEEGWACLMEEMVTTDLPSDGAENGGEVIDVSYLSLPPQDHGEGQAAVSVLPTLEVDGSALAIALVDGESSPAFVQEVEKLEIEPSLPPPGRTNTAGPREGMDDKSEAAGTLEATGAETVDLDDGLRVGVEASV